MSESEKRCTPECEFFRCGQRALVKQRSKIYCRWADDVCAGPTCKYAICARGRLLANGVCGFTVKRKTVETEPQEKKITIKIRGKTLQRLKGEELF
ncbi:hypothetical protein KAX03_02490 [Candidatus Bathyarchaeota archaeon]|nr:hypothetical protein [Candidatus Bathyarchaeota archaeon]